MRTLHDNIFKSLLDGLLYLILYIIIPTTQCVIYTIKDDDGFFFAAFLLLSSILYDCYTRYSSDMDDLQKKKIKWNVLASGITWLLVVVFWMFNAASFDILKWAVFFYVPSILIAAAIAIFDAFAQLQCVFSN